MLTVNIVFYGYIINGDPTSILKAKMGLRQRDHLSRLLFIIVMEYIYKILQKMKKNPNFNFHFKCKKMNFINMSFVNDFLLFAIGDVASIEILMATFGEFSASTCIYVNLSKCHVYFGNAKESIKL